MTERENTCFVLMPFDQRLDALYHEVILPSIEDAGLKARRADDMFSPNSILVSTRRAIEDAVLIIADVSERNPNVFFELGLAHALGKPILILTQDTHDVPFDLAHYRAIDYRLNDPRSIKSLKRRLVHSISLLGQEQQEIDSQKYLESSKTTPEDTEAKTQNILARAKEAQVAGNRNEEAQLLEEASAILEKSGNIELAASIRNNLGSLYQEMGQYQRALHHLQMSLDLLQRIGDEKGIAVTYGNLANTFATLGDIEQAQEFYRRAIDASTKIEDEQLRASILFNLGTLLLRQKRFSEAEEIYRQALITFRDINDAKSIASTYNQLATIKYSLNEYDEAETFLMRVVVEFERIGDVQGLASTLHNLGVIEAQMGKIDSAEQQLRKSLALKQQIGDLAGTASTFSVLAGVMIDKQEIQSALELYQQAMNIQRQIGDQFGLMMSLANMSSILEAVGAREVAIETIERAISIAEDIKAPERGLFDKQLAQLKTGEFSSDSSTQESQG